MKRSFPFGYSFSSKWFWHFIFLQTGSWIINSYISNFQSRFQQTSEKSVWNQIKEKLSLVLQITASHSPDKFQIPNQWNYKNKTTRTTFSANLTEGGISKLADQKYCWQHHEQIMHTLFLSGSNTPMFLSKYLTRRKINCLFVWKLNSCSLEIDTQIRMCFITPRIS